MSGPFLSRQFLTFLVTGGIAAAANFGSRLLYNHWLDFSTAVILAYLTGMVTAFILVNLVAVAQTWLISMGLAYYALPALGITRFAKELAHAVGIVVPVFTSYLGHKHLSFR